MEFRDLRADEIDVRVSQINGYYVNLLLYKDARVDINVLNESGVKWKRKHELIGDRLYCTVSIYDEDTQQWIDRQDVGTESYAEKEKGQASDSFKRACFNFGLGIELYTAPQIRVTTNLTNAKKDEKTGKWSCYDKFKVDKIVIENHRIKEISIVDESNGSQVYSWCEPKEFEARYRVEHDASGKEHKVELITEEQKAIIYKAYENNNEKYLKLLENNNIDRLEEMTRTIAAQYIKKIEKAKKKEEEA